MEELIKAKRLFDDFAKDCDKILKTLKKGNNMGKMKQKAIEARSDPKVFDALVEACEMAHEEDVCYCDDDADLNDTCVQCTLGQALKLAKGEE